MKVLLDEDSMGPFDVTVFGTFQLTPDSNPSKPGTVITRWYAGPSFPGAVEDLITGELFDVIKILPGRVVEFQVYQNRRGLEITSRTLFPLGMKSKTSAEAFVEQKAAIDSKMNALRELQGQSKGAAGFGGPFQSSCIGFGLGCSVTPCLPPNNAINCDNPQAPFCFQAEAPTALKHPGSNTSGCCG